MTMWQNLAEDYKNLIGNPDWDSQFLRRSGLVPNIVEMIGNCEDSVLLDAGTGTGWLFDYVKPAKAFACDVNKPEKVPDGVRFEIQDVESLTYADHTFDIIVASLLLIFCERLREVCNELYRIAKPNGGRLIVSVMHPYFYRTGYVTDDKNFLITEDLSQPFQIPLKIADQVGPLVYYYRPLPDYVNTLIDVGWEVRSLRDWFIDMGDYKNLISGGVRSKIKRTGQVPLYTFIECAKH